VGQLSGHLVQITRLGAEAAKALAAAEIVLREGSEVVVRVLQAPAGGGRGLLSLAGRQIPAELPAGLHEGERLRVVVKSRGSDTVALRIVRSGEAERGHELGRLAGALAVSGDPELVRVALALAGGAPVLPGGGAGSVRIDADASAEREPGSAAAHARVTLHSPELGPIEIALALTPSAVTAAVRTEPGRPSVLAREASAQLGQALERSTGRRAGVTVTARRADERRPAPPVAVDWIDVHA
jgi:hypothetical protein